jgi:formylglycine-generating enzyme required for sulfatase activity
MIAPQYAPAHMGRLLAQLHVTEERLLGDRVPPISIDENPHFKAALEHADPAYRRQILGHAVTLNRRFEEMRRIQPSEHTAGERRVLTINGVEYAFRFCPPGTFAMGSPHDEANRQQNETQHQVTLTRGFWMLETEVTQLMWLSVMGNNPSRFQGANLPVEMVSWNDAQEYIEKLNDLAVAPGFRFSLPTEAQWEYACRAGTITAFHFGNSLRQPRPPLPAGSRPPARGQPLPPALANFSGRQTQEVGSYHANAWGLRDMHGNVAEWVLDLLGEYPVGAVIDPAGTTTGSNRVVRGGGWNNDAQDCRSARRDRLGPSRQNSSTGLRLVLIITDESAAAQTLSDGTLALRESPAIVPPGTAQVAGQPTGHITVESAGGSVGTAQSSAHQPQPHAQPQLQFPQTGQPQQVMVPPGYAWHWDPRLQQWVPVQQHGAQPGMQPGVQPVPDRPVLRGVLDEVLRRGGIRF